MEYEYYSYSYLSIYYMGIWKTEDAYLHSQYPHMNEFCHPPPCLPTTFSRFPPFQMELNFKRNFLHQFHFHYGVWVIWNMEFLENLTEGKQIIGNGSSGSGSGFDSSSSSIVVYTHSLLWVYVFCQKWHMNEPKCECM